MFPERLRGSWGSPVAIQTISGYELMGKDPAASDCKPLSFFTPNENESVEKLVNLGNFNKVSQKIWICQDNFSSENIY